MCIFLFLFEDFKSSKENSALSEIAWIDGIKEGTNQYEQEVLFGTREEREQKQEASTLRC